jgi:hypothetical protein
VIFKYEEITGRHVIRDAGLQGTVSITKNPSVPMTAQEAEEANYLHFVVLPIELLSLLQDFDLLEVMHLSIEQLVLFLLRLFLLL